MTSTTKYWTKHHTHGLGSDQRVQRNYFAFLVMLAVAGDAVCPNCSTPFVAGDFDVDRTHGHDRDEQGSEVYRAGFICYVCKSCNQRRARLQERGADWEHAAQYQADVLNASLGIRIPTVAESKRWWKNRPVAKATKGKYE